MLCYHLILKNGKIIVIIVVGPKEIPNLLKKIGSFSKSIKKISREFKKSLNDLAEESDLKNVQKSISDIKDIKDDLYNPKNKQFIHLTENTNIEKMDLGIALDTIDQLNPQKYNDLLFKNALKYVFILNYNYFKINIPNDFEELYCLIIQFESITIYIRIYQKK